MRLQQLNDRFVADLGPVEKALLSRTPSPGRSKVSCALCSEPFPSATQAISFYER